MTTRKTTLEELRELNIERQKASRATGQEASQPERHTTSHTTGNLPDGPSDQPDDNMAGQPTAKPTEKPTSQPRRMRGDTPANAIIREIQDSVRVPPVRTVMKTVTIKMLPELDDKVEQHCRETGRKKQDVIRDALRLYFAAVETGQE